MSSDNQNENVTDHGSEAINWKDRFEELLKVKNLNDLKSELGRFATDLQSEIQNFDLNAHLSPNAKDKLKTLEVRYKDVVKSLRKAQKQFDREFNKNLRVLKKTRDDAEKHLSKLRSKLKGPKKIKVRVKKAKKK